MVDVTKPISEMTAAELLELSKQQAAKENEEQNKRKTAYVKDKEAFLQQVLTAFINAQDALIDLKKGAIANAENFNSLKYQLEGKTPKDAKSFELKNERIKIIVETQERFDFNDQAIVHISAIKDIFRKKFEDRNKGFYNLLDSILMKNTKCEYDAKLLTKARKQVREIGDDALITEFDKLNDCLVVVGSAKYVRVYVKEDDMRWKDVSLNFSSL